MYCFLQIHTRILPVVGMAEITRLLILTLCLLSVPSSSGSHRVKRNVHLGGYGGTCSLKPNLLHMPSCFWLVKFVHPKKGGCKMIIFSQILFNQCHCSEHSESRKLKVILNLIYNFLWPIQPWNFWEMPR